MNNSHIIKEILVQIIGFGVVFFILKQLAWKNILGTIDSRRDKIQKEWDSIEQKKKDLETLEKDYRSRLQNIEQEARGKIQEAANVGIALARDIQEKARVDAQKMVDRAKLEIEQDITKARITMRNDLVELSGLLTEKILSQKLDKADHSRLAEQFIKEIEKV